jgi:hypothetical protein
MIVVTGATGHIGNVLVRQIGIQNGKTSRIRVLVPPAETMEPLKDTVVEIAVCDVTDYQAVLKHIRGAKIVFHLAGIVSIVNGMRVSIPAPAAGGTAKARKVAVQPANAPAPPAAYGLPPVQPQYQQPPTYPKSAPPVGAMNFCPSCGAGVIIGSRFCPACGHQFGPSVQSNGTVIGAGKSTQVTLLLSLLPGLIGLLGLGHFYVRKYAKGAFLLVIGFFLAGLGLGSLLLLNDPAYAGSAASLIMALFFNLLFLMLLVYSVIDARKSTRLLNRGMR